MTKTQIKKAMTKEVAINLSSYVDDSNCFNFTKLAETIYDNSSDAEDDFDFVEIPEVFFDAAVEICEVLLQEGKVNE